MYVYACFSFRMVPLIMLFRAGLFTINHIECYSIGMMIIIITNTMSECSICTYFSNRHAKWCPHINTNGNSKESCWLPFLFAFVHEILSIIETTPATDAGQILIPSMLLLFHTTFIPSNHIYMLILAYSWWIYYNNIIISAIRNNSIRKPMIIKMNRSVSIIEMVHCYFWKPVNNNS